MNPNTPSASDAELDRLVYAYLQQRSAGVSHEFALEQSLASAPARAADLTESLEALKAAGLLNEAGVAGEDFPDVVGGYRLERRLGAGGMGVVFLARGAQGDPVALKLIRPEQLYFDGSRDRFEREFASAKDLEHEGIARVLDTGEDKGLPYLAQAWIPGVSLDVILSSLRTHSAEGLELADLQAALAKHQPIEAGAPSLRAFSPSETWERAMLKLVRDVAAALVYAHARGVLHRDVKPSNIMLTPEGRAVLVDFGLARTPDSVSLTRTGTQAGSLPYMAPEQLEGNPRAVDTRADVYALGVTLYELLSLRQPFRGSSAEAVRALIMDANPLPIRKLNGHVRRATRILCRKAMEFDPRRRYATAQEVVADIDRLLAGEPIHGRPPSAVVRLGRWTKRKPLLASLLLLALVIPSTWAGLTQWTITEVEAAFRNEQEAHRTLDRHLEMTLGAIHSLFVELASDEIPPTPHVQRTRLGAVELALEVMEDLHKERPDNAAVGLERARLMGIRAGVLMDLNETWKARLTVDQQINVLEGMVLDGPSELRRLYQVELATALLQRAALIELVEPEGQTREPYEHALLLLREMVASEERGTSGSGVRGQLAGALLAYAKLLVLAEREEDAQLSMREGLRLLKTMAPEQELTMSARASLAGLLALRLEFAQQAGGQQQLNSDDPNDDELAQATRIAELLDSLFDEPGLHPRLKQDLIEVAVPVALAFVDAAQDARAVHLSQQCITLAEQLQLEFPFIAPPRIRRHTIDAHRDLLARFKQSDPGSSSK